MSLLEVDGLCVEFAGAGGPLRVIDRMDLRVARGEVLGIVGESGCGKSMTSLALLQLVPAPGRIAAGSIRFDGTELLGLGPARMREVRGGEIAMIFQEPMTALNPVFTVGRQIVEVIERHRGLRGRAAREEAVALLDAVRIPEPRRRAGQYAHEMSGGMRQRAMIAMALAGQPRLLIADEPTTALDVTVQAQVFDLLRDVRRQFGTAIILITHNMGAIAELADRVMVMYAGRKIEEGAVADVLARPAHPYTRGLLECVLHLETGAAAARAGTGTLPEIPGMVPALDQLGPGCAFAPRCREALPRCRQERPALVDLGGGPAAHAAACWQRAAAPHEGATVSGAAGAAAVSILS
ncbi:peptide ABC transporter ATP-binding protein [Cupriavidus sp. USMAHM13]|uniref:Peptide ABC transporter ATP-binding protein n=1 Tax=Cupriavidus malaysiensis TaxID=367825 RepID=A0ABN4TS72_9BURK|nr:MULTISPECIES: ABC transporter ATP-binding protein [Cupriavidus]AOZ02552.1 peptide ABC transporter ATP-binding protein [Cupriavidus sp. USMAHM13]AOZ10092.1 peptide ABC transporter ATP-binding protein [Cupriavidus malaysiensis]